MARGAGPAQILFSAFLALFIPYAHRVTGEPERLNIAEEFALTVMSAQDGATFTREMAQVGLALLAAYRGDRAAAQEQYAAIFPQSGTMVTMFAMAADRLLGLLAQTMGDSDKAAEHFEDALVFLRKAGYRPDLAWTCHDYAQALLVGADSKPRLTHEDRRKAMDLLGESLAISSELGMRPLIERATALQERAGSQPARPPAYPDGLSPREVEVLRLVASGKSNPAVAEELFISINTVARHLTNIFAKTGTSNRAEASVYASRQGFV